MNNYNDPSQTQVGQDFSALQNAASTRGIQAEAKMDKPTELYHAIAGMESVNQRLASLICKLASQPADPEGLNDRREVCMVELLNEGPEMLDRMKTQMHDKLEEIESLLFVR